MNSYIIEFSIYDTSAPSGLMDCKAQVEATNAESAYEKALTIFSSLPGFYLQDISEKENSLIFS